MSIHTVIMDTRLQGMGARGVTFLLQEALTIAVAPLRELSITVAQNAHRSKTDMEIISRRRIGSNVSMSLSLKVCD